MKNRPPSAGPDLDATRASRGVVAEVNARVRAASAAKDAKEAEERSSRSGAARQAAMRLSQLVVTIDADLEAFRSSRKLRLTLDDLARARAILDCVNEALLAEAGSASDTLVRLHRAISPDPEGASSSGRPASARTSVRRPSVEVVAAPPVRPIPPEQAWSALPTEPAASVMAPTARALAVPVVASIADEETALGGADEDATHFFRRPEPAPPASPAVQTVELTIEQHAALSAECDAYPQHRGHIEKKYGLADTAARDAVDAAWHQRFTRDDALWNRWHELYAAYRGSLT